MEPFELYFRLGISHILDFAGYDHILFVVVLCSLYTFSDWKKLVALVSSFTIGHTLTLAIATFKMVNINADLIEFLIPLTIVITAAGNILRPKKSKGMQLNYFFAFFFGLIHGLGFSNYLSSLLGKEDSLVKPLFAFNIGLEAGQLLIVSLFLFLTWILLKFFKVNQTKLTLVISSIILGIALKMAMG